MRKILLVDDDPQALDSTRKILELSGYAVTTAVDGQAALEQIRPGLDSSDGRVIKTEFDLILSDVRMPRLGGLEFLRALSLCGETTPVVLMTAFGRVEDAVWAMKMGAVDFLTKPFKRQALVLVLESALKRAKPKATLAREVHPNDYILGNSQAVKNLRALIAQVAPTAATVMISGESGTGKELVAKAIHEFSPRAKNPFIALNCAAIPEQLIESELFGHEKGSFTGASSAKTGLFEAANGGTLLLDEIGDMPLALQAKLLRTLQESEVRKVGSTLSRKVDVRVVSATHRDLKESVKQGTFRQDLLYRLEVISIVIPSLRERTEDVPELAYHFLKQACVRHGKDIKGVSEEALEALLSYPWPGNVRELSNVMERAVVLTTAPQILLQDLPPHLMARPGDKAHAQFQLASSINVPVGTPLKDVEELLIRKTLEATSGDKNLTARLLGINSRTIYRKLDKRTD